jgi:hypothetical protein
MTTKNPKAYKAPHEVYTGGVLYKPGQVFVTAEPKGAEWEAVGDTEKAATDAADPQKHDDVNLEALDVSALKGHAASLGVDLGEAKSKADIITVIKARNDPTR